jgi:DNA polymerase-3 subunit gamma/tau
MSEVFYRKWRPRRLDQVVGQEAVGRTIRNAVVQGRVAHAYLFCGPRGTGKTSTARILAKALNCLAPEGGEPDDACEICVSVNEGRAMDLIEIDAASNRGIDDIRNLREKVGYSPSVARHKIYIIDEVHMLTDAAFNALLKTLEEPPPHAVFVLATTEAHKVPLTIISRCQRFDFRRIPIDASVARLAELCAGEGVEASNGALTLIARAASGSLRDAQNLLERALVSYGSPLSETQVGDLLELGSDERALELVGHIVDRAVKEGLTVINEVAGEGVDLRLFYRGIMEYLRGLLLIKAGAATAMGFSDEAQAEMEKIASRAALGHLVLVTRTFAGVDVRRDSSSPLPLELAMVESTLAKEAPASAVAPPAPQITAPPPQAPAAYPQSRASAPARSAPPAATARSQAPPPAAPAAPQSGADRQWGEILRLLRGVKGKRFDLGALLRVSTDREIGDGTFTLKYSHSSHMERVEEELQDHASRTTIEEAVAKVLGGKYDIKVVAANGQSNGPRQTPARRSHLVRAAQSMGAKLVSEREENTHDEQKDAQASPAAPEEYGKDAGGA